MISPTAIENFKANLRGELPRPSDPGYDDARSNQASSLRRTLEFAHNSNFNFYS